MQLQVNCKQICCHRKSKEYKKNYFQERVAYTSSVLTSTRIKLRLSILFLLFSDVRTQIKRNKKYGMIT
eukprot:snap_masked-scaffold_5-processed-gene-17.18-mRNA-1 protein AED:1.00 eAED:1.00 QI:0/-1/0/0/-1/1/1/0/68